METQATARSQIRKPEHKKRSPQIPRSKKAATKEPTTKEPAREKAHPVRESDVIRAFKGASPRRMTSTVEPTELLEQIRELLDEIADDANLAKRPFMAGQVVAGLRTKHPNQDFSPIEIGLVLSKYQKTLSISECGLHGNRKQYMMVW